MWRNADVLPFIRWLRSYNPRRRPETQIGFYGLDMYSLYRSAAAVVAYLERVDPEQAELAREQYAALDHARSAALRLRSGDGTAPGLPRGRAATPDRAAAARAGLPPARRQHRARRGAVRRRAQRARGGQWRGLLPQHVRRPPEQLEPARLPHDADPVRAAGVSARGWPRRAASGVGAHRTWATPAPPRWATPASGTWASWCVGGSVRAGRCWWVSPPIPAT